MSIITAGATFSMSNNNSNTKGRKRKHHYGREKEVTKDLSFLGEDRKVFVGLHRKDKEAGFGGDVWALDDAKLRAAFEKIGRVESANMVLDKATNKSRGFGFVKFAEKVRYK